MYLKKFLVFGLIAAVLPAVAEEAADRKTATSLKYVEHELDTRQDKFTAEANKAMEYTNAAGDVQKRTVKSDLGTNTSDTSLPMVGGVNTKLATKQDDIAAVNDHTAVTYTGQPGGIGQKGIYQTTESYAAQSDNLIDAKTFNAALKRGLDSEFLCSEYKPGTDLCWVWSIHNTGDNNLFTTAGATLNKYYSESGTEGNGTYPQYGYNFAHTNFIEVQPNTTYTLSITCGGFETVTNHRVIAWDANRGFIAQIANNVCSAGYTQRKSTTFTTTATTKYLTINYVYDPAGENPRLELGSSETEVPYTTLVPAGYTPVEFIESNGTQYIDTDIKGHMNYTYELDFQQKDTNNYRNWGVFNQSTWQGQNMSFTWSSGWAVRWASAINGTNIVDLGRIDTNRHTLRIVDGEIYFDGVDRGRSTGHDSSFVFNYNLFLGTINPGGTTPTSNAKSKYYSYRVWDANGNLIQNFVPARQDSDNKVGMYDTVSGRFFPSVPANTNFAAGPDISNIVYVPQNQ